MMLLALRCRLIIGTMYVRTDILFLAMSVGDAVIANEGSCVAGNVFNLMDRFKKHTYETYH